VIRDDPEALAAFREAMKAVNQHDLPDDNVIGHHAEQGNSRAYSIARVQRECDPETVAAVRHRACERPPAAPRHRAARVAEIGNALPKW
jgi:hypothetical protein